VHAALTGRRVGLTDNWLRHVQDVKHKHGRYLGEIVQPTAAHDRLVELNVAEQVIQLRQTTVVQDAWDRGQELTIHSWVYGLSGDTLFANMHLAWDTLPAALRHAAQGARAEHSYLAQYEELRRRSPFRPALTQAQLDEVKPVVHPVVRTHPETGRKALFVSEHFTTRIAGIPEDESRALLAELFAHSVKPEHVYRHRWAPHDMVFWDNRSLMHLAGGTPEHLRRKLYRTTIEGDVPF
jgi:alpha-ketoglutarate-dependent taurine dioxygenase